MTKDSKKCSCACNSFLLSYLNKNCRKQIIIKVMYEDKICMTIIAQMNVEEKNYIETTFCILLKLS